MLGGNEIDMQTLSCNAQDALFAIAIAQVPAGASPVVATEHWRRTTLAHVQATDVIQNTPNGLTTRGVRPGGGSLAVAVQWVNRGPFIVQLAVYADNPKARPVGELLKPEIHEPFFGGLRWAP